MNQPPQYAFNPLVAPQNFWSAAGTHLARLLIYGLILVRWGGGALANFMYEKGSRFLDTFSPYSFLRT